MFAHDLYWWKHYGQEVKAGFAGEMASAVRWPGVEQFKVPRFPNSGCGAVAIAAARGAKRIILGGYDCQKTDGKSHHHGDHPRTLGNAGSIATWLPMFRRLALDMQAAGVTIINASRETALTVFELQPLEIALAQDATE